MGMEELAVDDSSWMEDEADSVAVAHCPYCGEPNEILLDPGGGENQSYIEDCEVCCHPWTVKVQWWDGVAQVQLFTEDEAVY